MCGTDDIAGEGDGQEEPPPPGLEQEKEEEAQSTTESQEEEARPEEKQETEEGNGVESDGEVMEVRVTLWYIRACKIHVDAEKGFCKLHFKLGWP